ncbi:cytochrome c oxidase assembly factor CtaG [Salsuginibacillus kocurii]|uniref:cytochrome c oxidase assembly factor CtaG n=1 Tax=Salsuginibacillus kocurii TaxID=427078 RepID=UPI00036325D9|nr:cytochrome c oxidase assembly factor CtaG [Salsuginibacillus kocurii]
MGEYFSTLSFRGLWTPELIAVLLVVFGIYYLLTRKWRHRFVESEPQSKKQDAYFILGLAALYIGWGGPLYAAGHMVLSIHMAQMVAAYFVAAPLFILAMPKWLLYIVMNKWKEISPLTNRVIMNPLIGLLAFNSLFSFYHIPGVFDALMLNVGMHSFYEVLLLMSAMLMWWHMISPLPTEGGLTDLRRIGYVFANGLLITPACALIIFANDPMYNTYTDASTWATVMAYCLPAGDTIPLEMFNWTDNVFLTPLLDQQLAGVLMKVMQEVTYGITIGYIFKQWLKKEKFQEGDVSISDIPKGAKVTE